MSPSPIGWQQREGMYEACVMYAEAYGQDGELIGAEPSNSRATRQGGAQRGGKCKVLHTFRRGNKVEVHMEGATHYAHVFGVAFSGKETSPRLKYLLLRDECTGIYFVARFGAFSRTLLQPGAAGADVDDDEQVWSRSQMRTCKSWWTSTTACSPFPA